MEPIKLETTSVDSTQLNLEALYQIAPSCFTEEKDEKTGLVRQVVNFQTLRQLLGDNAVDKEEEMYQFTWPGKQAARREAAVPITDTLRPVPEDSVDWDTTQNLYIEGDNLRVLKLLQRGYMGKVKMIYIDPPYNTGNDFVYHDDFAHSAAEEDLAAGNIDIEGIRYRRNTDSNGRFHSDWCSMMYSRLLVARSLLTEDGVIFISIDDNEVRNLKNLCDEVFGEGNFVAELVHQRAKGGGQAKYIVRGHDYILVYGKTIDKVSLSRKKVIQQKTIEINGELYIKNDDVLRKQFGKYDKSNGDRRCFYEQIVEYKGEEKKQEIDAQLERGNLFLELNSEGMHTICRYEKVSDATSKLYSIIKVLSEEGKKELDSLNIIGFSYPKPLNLMTQIIDAGTSSDSLILDFFSGSATTAHAVMQLNAEDIKAGKESQRKYICVQLPEETPEDSEARKAGYASIPEIAKERIRRAGKKILETLDVRDKTLDLGFRVFKLDSSNFGEVSKAPGEYSQDRVDLFLDNIKADRNDLDLLFGAMLSWGVQLSLPMQTEDVDGCKVYSVDGNGLVACFAENITENVVKTMAGKQPLRVLFRDSCFAEDKTKINIFELFKQQLDWDENEAMQNIRVI